MNFFPIFLAGCAGGLVNAVLAGALELPKTDKVAGVWKTGWVGNVLIWATAALVFWGLYGGLADSAALGDVANTGTDPATALKEREFVGALLSGVGRSRALTDESDKKLLDKERRELETTKGAHTETIRELTKK